MPRSRIAAKLGMASIASVTLLQRFGMEGPHKAALNPGKLPSKPLGQSGSKQILQQQPTQKRRHQGKSGWAIAAVLVAIGCIGGGTWLGLQLMVNPQALLWINRLLPDWIPIPITGLKPPQTLEQIRRELMQAGRIPGEPLPLGKNTSFIDGKSTAADLLLPVLVQQPNSPTGSQLVELRVYQSALTRSQNSHTPYFQLVNQLAIAGPEESFAIAPLIDAKSANQGSTRTLPLTELSRFEQNVPSAGVWLNLSGRLNQGDGTVAYGQVIHYNPSRFHLSFLLEWSSPTGEDPVWQEATGGGTPELIVNQTIGLEPQFRIYQVKPRDFLPDPVQLEPISLLEPALNHQTYENALLLARSGLWSTSWQWVRSLKRQTGQKWSVPAQAQLDLIGRHAIATRSQADSAWASPSQQILANLIDGRWERALQVFEKSSANSLEAAAMLKADSGRLQNRVDATVQVNAAQRSAKAWGGLLIAAQRGRHPAIAWLKKQPKTTAADIAWVNRLISRLAPSPEPEAISSAAPGQIVGSATRLNRINPAEWLKPKQSPALKLENQQVWYQVDVAGFHDGKRWRLPGSPLGVSQSTSVATLWKMLGLLFDPPLQIILWLPNGEQETAYASIKAIRVRSGRLQLLAAGDSLSKMGRGGDRPRPLALTDAALQWLSPDTTSLADVVQQPAWAKTAVPLLGRELKKYLPPGAATTWDSLESLGMGDWLVQLVPFSGSQADVVLTIYPEALSNLKNSGKPAQFNRRNSRPRTLIFSAAGKLLYSEFSADADQTFLAIADLGDGGSNALVVDGSRNYDLLRWSVKRRRFE